MQDHSRPPLGPSRHRAILLLAAAIGVLVAPLGAQNACIKTITAAPTLNGVVAGGASTVDCSTDVVWQGVEPLELHANSGPSGGLAPGGYLYFAFQNPAGPGNDRLWIGVDIAQDDDVSDWDILYLIFDADNNNTWNAGDFFIKVPVSSSGDGINTGSQCSQPCGTKEYWEHNGTSFQPVDGVAASINVSMAYDYETDIDPELKIWNLEIDMPVATVIGGVTRFNLQTGAAPFFGVGAYVFVDRGHIESPGIPEGSVLRWPSTMDPRSISDQNLFGIPAVEATELGGVSLTNTCFDVNFTVADPWRINGQVAATNDNRIIRNGVNNFRVRFKYQGPDGGTGSLPNPGQVRLSLTPFNASFWQPNNSFTKTKTQSVTPTPAAFPGEYYVDFSWNFGSAAESWSTFESAHGQVEFLCAQMWLQNFTRDDNTGNNYTYVNHNEFTTSEYTHELAILSENIPGLRSGETARLRLQMVSMNDPEARRGSGPEVLRFLDWPGLTVAWLAAAALGLLTLLIGRRHRRSLGGGYALLGTAVLLAGCQQISQIFPLGGGQPQRWQIENAENLGMRPIEGSPGWYEMPIRHGEVKRLSLRFRGRPLPYRTVQRRLTPADSAGRINRMRFDVQPGGVVTVLAFGEIDLDGRGGPLPRNSATGFTLPESQQTLRAAAAQGGLLLRDGYYRAAQHAGALVGSFDNWQHVFVIGRAASLVVPPNARELQVAVNGVVQERGARMMEGEYEINVITTPPRQAPTHTVNKGDATFFIPPSIDTWRVLTSLNVYTYSIQEDRNRSGAVIGQTLQPAGAAHYSIYAVH